MLATLRLGVVATLLVIAQSQTPPDFMPSCSELLHVTYCNDIVIRPGDFIQASGMPKSDALEIDLTIWH